MKDLQALLWAFVGMMVAEVVWDPTPVESGQLFMLYFIGIKLMGKDPK